MELDICPRALRWIERNAHGINSFEAIAACNVNYDYFLLAKMDTSYVVLFFVNDPDMDDNLLNEIDTKDRAEAEKFYRTWVAESCGYKAEPDWEAQAAYDEAHGTINGSDPAIVAWQEEFSAECY